MSTTRRLAPVFASAICAGLFSFAAANADLRDWGDNYVGVKFSNPSHFAISTHEKGAFRSSKGDREQVKALIAQEASRQSVPRALALAVAKVESGYSCHAIGPKTRHGRAVGPLQILPKSAARLGYPTSDLNNCNSGLAAGMAHLAECYKLANGDTVRTAACHVGGPGMASGPRGKYARQYVVMVTNTLGRIE
jgi:soluble lytic murein transglycosylase-like protein